MKKVLFLLLCTSGMVVAIDKARAEFGSFSKYIEFGGTSNFCGALKIVNTSDGPVKLIGNEKEVVLAKKGDAVHFKYDGPGRKEKAWKIRAEKLKRFIIVCKVPMTIRPCPFRPGSPTYLQRCKEWNKEREREKAKNPWVFSDCAKVVKLQDIEYNKICKMIKASYKPFEFIRKKK